MTKAKLTPPKHRPPAGSVLVTESTESLLRGLYTADHMLLADEPEDKGGTNLGPNPYDYLLMALGSCTSMTLRMYAEHKGLPVSNIEVTLKHERIHAEDCADCETKKGQLSRIERVIRYDGDLSPEQHQRFLQIADRCPVHRTLSAEIRIDTDYQAKD
ncbi:MAG: OsmC family protein [Saccharospirillum sp.]